MRSRSFSRKFAAVLLPRPFTLLPMATPAHSCHFYMCTCVALHALATAGVSGLAYFALAYATSFTAETQRKIQTVFFNVSPPINFVRARVSSALPPVPSP